MVFTNAAVESVGVMVDDVFLKALLPLKAPLTSDWLEEAAGEEYAVE